MLIALFLHLNIAKFILMNMSKSFGIRVLAKLVEVLSESLSCIHLGSFCVIKKQKLRPEGSSKRF